MAGTVRYFALSDYPSKRELSATSIGEAITMLQPGEILSTEHTAPVDERIRAHSLTIIQYRNLHRSALAEIRRRRVYGTLKPKSLVILLADAAAYRRIFESHRKALRGLLDFALIESCNERTCVECRQEIA